ncbi:MAG: hypothetical protein HYU67_00025 [Flavobacteriia bacterium]|nr:hypothetical protein [Flavobacteriia bacterium]
MEKLITRLKYYGIGFAIGLVFVFIFFQNRGCSWLPSNRVKNTILDKTLVISEKEEKIFNEKNISKKQIVSFLEKGTVHFNESKKEGFLKIYVLSIEKQKLYFLLPKDSYIAEVQFPSKSIKDTRLTESGFGKALHFPNEKHLLFADSSAFKTCKEKNIYLNDVGRILDKMKNSGKINFEKSKHYASPKATINWVFKDNNDSIEVNTYWYKNKINIFSVTGQKFKDCE